MLQKPIGECPSGELPHDENWCWRQVKWGIKVLKFCCGAPFPWGTLDCLQEDPEGLGPPAYPQPLGISLYYEDGCEEGSDIYGDRCSEVYVIFCDAIQWKKIRPQIIQKYFHKLGYDQHFIPSTKSPPTTYVAMSMEEIDEMERKKDDNCDLELVRFSSVLGEDDKDSDLTGFYFLKFRFMKSIIHH